MFTNSKKVNEYENFMNLKKGHELKNVHKMVAKSKKFTVKKNQDFKKSSRSQNMSTNLRKYHEFEKS